MRALLLAAGFGTRLRPLTLTVPKCMVPICGRPLLDHWLELLLGAGISRALVNLHYLPEVVTDYLRDSIYSGRVDAVYEERLLGTAGTLRHNRDYFEGQPVMLVHADNLSMFDVQAMIQAYETRPDGAEITMMTFLTETPESCGIVVVGHDGMVREFYEKTPDAPGRLANGAVYIVSPSVVDFLSTFERDQIDFSTDVLPHYVGRMNTFHNAVYHRDIGTLQSLRAAELEYPAVLGSVAAMRRES